MKKVLMITGASFLLSSCWLWEEVEKGDNEDRSSCEERVKRDYPVPPGNVNEQRQLIQQECG